ncbi:MAG TPA: RNA polymerase sigma factor [Nitrososphaera sp.]|nr:RNA polymerase sigma factor [Nitrososphaera sp.]
MNREDDSDVARSRRARFEDGAAKLSSKLFAIVYSRTLDPDWTNDIVQEAFCRFVSHMEKVEWSQDIENVDAFLTTIALNLRNTGWRKRQKEGLVSLDSLLEEKQEEVPLALLSNSLATDIDNGLDLAKLQEEVPLKMFYQGIDKYDVYLLTLHKVEDLSPKKIAEITGLNVDSLRYRLTKIEAKIRYRAKKYLKASGKKSLF